MAKAKIGRKSNGNGTVYFSEAKKKWYGEIQWTDKSGVKHRKKFSDSKQSVVKNKLKEFSRELIVTKGDMGNDDITFQEFVDLRILPVLKNKLKPTSYTRKVVTLQNQVYPYLGNIPISDITHYDVQDMVNSLADKGLSYSTVKKAFEAVSQSFRQYRIFTMSQSNPCEGIFLPEKNKQELSDIKFFNEKERQLIKNEAIRKYSNGKPVYRLGYAIVLLMYSGMRIGELLALTWDDIDFDRGTININKNAVVVKDPDSKDSHYVLINQKSTKTLSGSRIIPMTSMARTSLEELYKINGDKDYVMSTKNNTQIVPRNINRMFHNILFQTGLAKSEKDLCGVHTLRHTFASMLFNNGCPVKVVSEILGHSDTKITENIYIHVIQDQKVKAIEDIDKYSN